MPICPWVAWGSMTYIDVEMPSDSEKKSQCMSAMAVSSDMVAEKIPQSPKNAMLEASELTEYYARRTVAVAMGEG